MADNFKIECPKCGHPVVMRTTAEDEPTGKTFSPLPSKENRDKIMEAVAEMQKHIGDGFTKIFDKSLWR